MLSNSSPLAVVYLLHASGEYFILLMLKRLHFISNPRFGYSSFIYIFWGYNTYDFKYKAVLLLDGLPTTVRDLILSFCLIQSFILIKSSNTGNITGLYSTIVCIYQYVYRNVATVNSHRPHSTIQYSTALAPANAIQQNL